MLNISKIEIVMREQKISKAQLCSISNLARTTLDSILNGSDARISTIESIAKALNVRVGYFFDEEELEVRAAGRDYVEKGKIEHHGAEYNAPMTCANSELEKENAELKQKLIDAQERIIKLMEERK